MKFETYQEQLFFSTVRIETGHGVGTGCIFAHQWTAEGKTKTGFFLVTNRHVVEGGGPNGRFFLHLGKNGQPLLGSRQNIQVENFEKRWRFHPTEDLAVLPLVPALAELRAQGVDLFMRAIPLQLIPTKEQLEDIKPIQDIVFIGYPDGLYDTVNLLPIARRGATATPVSIDYDGKPRFLIDASVFPGSSGSPVFVCAEGPQTTEYGEFAWGERVMFLGMISSVAYQNTEGSLTFEEAPTALRPKITTRQMIDLGIVIKAHVVQELVLDLLQTAEDPPDPKPPPAVTVTSPGA